MRLLRRVTARPETDEDEGPDPEQALEPDEPEPGPHLLHDGPLLARWYIFHELEREMRRATRHERPLSVMVLTPTPTLGATPSEESLMQAVEAAKRSSRVTDLIGWLPGGGILVVMPETDRDGAAAAAYRWKNEMYTSTMRQGAIRWQLATNFNASNYESAQALLEAACADLRPADTDAEAA